MFSLLPHVSVSVSLSAGVYECECVSEFVCEVVNSSLKLTPYNHRKGKELFCSCSVFAEQLLSLTAVLGQEKRKDCVRETKGEREFRWMCVSVGKVTIGFSHSKTSAVIAVIAAPVESS
jgi:hypothetical protein